MAMTTAALASELSTDPASMGYAALIAAGNVNGIVALINSLTSPGAATITLSSVPKNTFLAGTLAAAVRLGVGIGTDNQTQLSAAILAKWGAVFSQARAADPGSAIDLTLMTSAALGNPVTDLVMAQAEYTALTSRTGTRAEVLWGAGTAPANEDVIAALASLS